MWRYFRRILARSAARRVPRPGLACESLEERALFAVDVLSQADPDLFGESGNAAALKPRISADGQLAVFESTSFNLAPGDQNNASDVFLRDLSTGETTLVSQAFGGNGASDGASTNAFISADGRYIVYESTSTNLISGFVNRNGSSTDIYRYDTQTGVTELVSQIESSSVSGSNGTNTLRSISDNGQFILWESTGFDYLATDDVNGAQSDVYLRDMTAGPGGMTKLVSARDGLTGGASGQSLEAVMTPDGRFVAFRSVASFSAVDLNGHDDIYVRDVQTMSTVLVSSNVAGTDAGNFVSRSAAISSDGRYVAFQSDATNLIAGDSNSATDIFLRDIIAGTTTRVSVNSAGSALASNSAAPVVSADGRYVAFVSSGLFDTAVTDANGASDVFVRDTVDMTTTLISRVDGGAASGNAASGTNGSSAVRVQFSADHRYVLFSSMATDLTTAADSVNTIDFFLHDLVDGSTRLISTSTGAAAASAVAESAVMTPDAAFVAFASSAASLVSGDNNAQSDVFFRDVAAESTALVSRRDPNQPFFTGDGNSNQFVQYGELPQRSASADGRYVVYTTTARNIDAYGTAASQQVVLHDRQTGTNQIISRSGGGVVGNGESYAPVISADGRYIAFLSTAPNLLPGGVADGGPGADLFLYDRIADALALVTRGVGGQSGNGETGRASPLSISADGSRIAFISQSSNLVASDLNIYDDVFLYDRTVGPNGTITLVSHVDGGANSGNQISAHASISADGAWIAYQSHAGDLVAGDTNGSRDIFLYEVATGLNRRISVSSLGAQGNSNSILPVMSADGRYIAFYSSASNLVANDTGGNDDVFVHDRIAATTILVSQNQAGTGSGNFGVATAQPVSMSDDGSKIAFISSSSNLVLGDGNSASDVFVRDWQAGETMLASANSLGTSSGNAISGVNNTRPFLSGSGRYVTFTSQATDLVDGFVDGNGATRSDLYLRDLEDQVTSLITAKFDGSQSGDAHPISTAFMVGEITANDGAVIFTSISSDLVVGDPNRGQNSYLGLDVFAYEIGAKGVLNGRVYLDQDSDGTPDLGEPGLAGWTAFLDTDDDGVRDAGETATVTQADGSYAFQNVPIGLHHVRIEVEANYVLTAPSPLGKHSAEIVTNADVVAGLDFGLRLARLDLALGDVAMPAIGAVGETIAVTWRVENQGETDAVGGWQDAVYLSEDATLDSQDKLVALVSHAGGLAAGDFYIGLANVAVPALFGAFHVIVESDRRRQTQDFDRDDLVAAAVDTISIDAPLLFLDVPYDDQFTTANQDRLYRIDIVAGRPLLVQLDSAAATGSLELYVRYGIPPTTYDFDAAGRVAASPDQAAVVPVTQTGTYFILVHSRAGAATTDDFSILVTQPEFSLESIDTNSAGDAGFATIGVRGFDFSSATEITLARGATTLVATKTQLVDPTLIYATFDLTGTELGAYDVVAVDGAESDVLTGVFEVVAGTGGRLEYDVIAPALARVGRESFIVVTYKNVGSNDIDAPLLTMSSEKEKFRLLDQAGYVGDTIQFLGLTEDGRTVLRAGEAWRAIIYDTSTTFIPHDLIVDALSVLEDPEQSMDWDALQADLRPDDVAEEAWEIIFANFRARAGETAGDFHQMLLDTADHFAALGAPTNDVRRLVDFQLQIAGGDGAIAARFRDGALGLGQPDATVTRIELEDDGTVAMHVGDLSRAFYLTAELQYRAAPGDAGQLSKVGDSYRIRELTGETLVFRADGLLDYVQDASGNRNTWSYDAEGRTATVTSSATGVVTTYAYDAAGRILLLSTSTGLATSLTYDAAGRLETIESQGVTATYSYVESGPAKNAVASVTVGGDVTTLSYDALGRLAGTTRGAAVTTIAYDAFGRQTTTDAEGRSTVIASDDRGLVLEAEAVGGANVGFEYDPQGNVVTIVGADGSSSRRSYDALGRVTQLINPLGHVYELAYGTKFAGATRVVDPAGNVTLNRYDSAGRLLETIYPDGSRESLTYSANGFVQTVTSRAGDVVAYSYDASGLLIEKDRGSGDVITYGYDAARNLVSVTSALGTMTLDYDAHQRIERVTDADGRWVEYAYDSAGRRAALTTSDGFTQIYAYTPEGWLDSLRDASGVLVDYAYDAGGYVIRKDFQSGAAIEYAYDAAGRLTLIENLDAGAVLASRYAYTYDALGRRDTATMQIGADPAETWTYGYDAAGQLISVSGGGWTISYAYDANGNRLATNVNGALSTYVANALNQYTTAADVDYAYDDNGAIVAKITATGTTTCNYDVEGRLVGMQTETGDNFVYHYDGLGNLAAVEKNGVTTDFALDYVGLGTIIGEYADDALVAHYVQGSGLEGRIDAGGNGGYFAFDVMGNTVGFSDASGVTVNSYAYLPFGEVITASETIATPFKFGGSYGMLDFDNGENFIRRRQYDPVAGRFDSPDFLRTQTENRYAYAYNQPTMLYDPTGLAPQAGNPSQALGDVGNVLTAGGTGLTALQGLFSAGAKIGTAAEAAQLTGLSNTLGNFGTGLGFIGAGVDAASLSLTGMDYQAGKADGLAVAHDSALVTADVGALSAGFIGSPVLAVLFGLFGAFDWATKYGFEHTLSELEELRFQEYKEKALAKAVILKQIDNRYARRDGVISGDPNEVEGPGGYDPDPLGASLVHWIQPGDPMPYTIRFENDPEIANAAAQDVVITSVLDADLDWSTFELASFGFGSLVFEVPAGHKEYAATIPYQNADGSALDVAFSVTFDETTGTMVYTFRSFDPVTGTFPADPLAGFLRVEDGSGDGQGFVSYLIEQKSGLATGTVIEASAGIVFDINDPVLTNVYVNTIDDDSPASSVDALPAEQNVVDILVRWSGTDAGAGVATYDIYVQLDCGCATLWLDDTTATSAAYSGEFGRSYSFFSVAADNVGHAEDLPLVPDATITLVAPNSDPVANHDNAIVAQAYQGTRVTATLDVLANDSTSPDLGETLSIVAVTPGSAGGSVVISAGGARIAYSPLASFVGVESFAYTVSDGRGGTATASVTVLVQAAPLPPAVPSLAVALDAGKQPLVNVYDSRGQLVGRFYAFEKTFKGGVRVAMGDVNGDRIPDVIVGTGAGTTARVRVIDGTKLGQLATGGVIAPSAILREIKPFGRNTGGAFLAAGDVNGDLRDEVIVGGTKEVRIFDGATGVRLFRTKPFGSSYTGGVTVAAADFDGDDRSDFAVGRRIGKTDVRIYSGASFARLAAYRALGSGSTAGVNLAAADLDGDRRAELIVGANSGAAKARVFDGAVPVLEKELTAYFASFKGGVRVAVGDLNGDGRSDIVAAGGPKSPPRIRAVTWNDTLVADFFAAAASTKTGLFVGGATQRYDY